MDSEASNCLMAGGWKLCRDWVWRHPDGNAATEREVDAAIYLIEEWDYGGIDGNVSTPNREG